VESIVDVRVFWQPGSITVTDAVVLFMYLSQINIFFLFFFFLCSKIELHFQACLDNLDMLQRF